MTYGFCQTLYRVDYVLYYQIVFDNFTIQTNFFSLKWFSQFQREGVFLLLVQGKPFCFSFKQQKCDMSLAFQSKQSHFVFINGRNRWRMCFFLLMGSYFVFCIAEMRILRRCFSQKRSHFVFFSKCQKCDMSVAFFFLQTQIAVKSKIAVIDRKINT